VLPGWNGMQGDSAVAGDTIHCYTRQPYCDVLYLQVLLSPRKGCDSCSRQPT
jgi:hypothetical protein